MTFKAYVTAVIIRFTK